MFSVENIVQATRGQLLQGNDVEITGIAIDSRAVKRGDLFVAITGEKTDGHLYIQKAVDKGARAVLVEKPVSTDVPVILTTSTVYALGRLAQWYRNQFNIPVVGITGSVGKTTTKEMMASVLASRFSVLKSQGNLNTEIGLPLTLFGLKKHHEVVVVEMGMRGLGQIRELAKMARPNVGVITNIGENHLELLGSKENILKAKWELAEALPPEGTLILNRDDDLLLAKGSRMQSEVLWYGTDRSAMVRAENISVQGEGLSFDLCWLGEKRIRVELPVPGRHNVSNALAAAAVGLAFGLTLEEIAKGLSMFTNATMRLDIQRYKGITVINDAYNASPVSMMAALEVLADLAKGRKIAVLSDMLELGDWSMEGHRQVGRACKVDILYTYGEMARDINGAAPDIEKEHFGSREALADKLIEILKPGDTVLVKGSRGMKMEDIVKRLVDNYA